MSFPVNGPPMTRIRRIATFFIGASVLGIAWQVVVAGLLGKLLPEQASAALGVLQGAIVKRDLLYSLGVVVLAPIIEEFVFRYGLFALLYFPRFGVWPTTVFSALPFGLLHLYSSLLSAVFATLTGIIFGYIYAVTRDIWCAVGAHAGVNFAAFCVVALSLL